ncbi:hypothetical protein B0186_04675 [Canicola haemoglobinophilus]|nr:hypothetical protein [Canicola haemoglobinophilus]OOS01223.1 hypothetical protein B0186_04675 [Canicola haemoglobinophilus]
MKKTLDEFGFRSIRVIDERGFPKKIYWKMIADNQFNEEIFKILQKMKIQVQRDKTSKEVQEPVL